MAHMERTGGSKETATEANKAAHEAFCNLAILIINFYQQLIIINPSCFTLSVFALLAEVAQFIKTCMTDMCSTKGCIVPLYSNYSPLLLMQLSLGFTLE